MTKDQIAQIRERAEAATAGPWRWDAHPQLGGRTESLRCGNLSMVVTWNRERQGSEWTYISVDPNDKDFIAHARTDVPKLCTDLTQALDENEALRAEVERLKRLEWDCLDKDGAPFCSECLQYPSKGHSPDCHKGKLCNPEQGAPR